MDDQTLLVVAFNATVTLLVLAVIYRPLVIESVDPLFLRTVSRAGAPAHLAFLALVVVNLVNGFQALGTLLAVGLMILPAGIARFWSRDITGMICIAVVSAIVSGYAGLVLSFQTGIPSGPAIILVAAVLYIVSVLFGSCRRPGAAGSFPAAISKPDHAALSSSPVVALIAPRCPRAPRIAQRRRELFHPRRSRAQCRRRHGRCHDAGRPRQRRACLYAGAGGREEDRRCKARSSSTAFGLEGWLPRLVQSSGSKAKIVTATQRHRAAAARHRCRSACLAVGRQREDLCRQHPRCADRGRRPGGRRSIDGANTQALSGRTRCAGSRGARRPWRKSRRSGAR